MNLLITAGIPHDKIDELQERYNENFRRYVKAELLFLDWHRKEKILWKRNYRSPSENRNPAMMFKGGQRSGKRINVVTNSEIVIYESDSWNIKQVISHPHFNDLHSVMYSKKLYWVANTGLEIVQAVNNEGEIIEEYNMTDIPTWERFDRNIDYRKIGSTKPHRVHVNYVFSIDGRIYVTRFMQRDAVCMSDKRKRFDIRVGNPHDGCLYEGKVYFSTTNGHIIIFDMKSRRLIQDVDVNQIMSSSRYIPGGWCRGVCPISKDRIIVGFSRLRSSKFREFGSWIKHLGKNTPASRIVEIDIKKNIVIDEFKYPYYKGAAIYSIILMS